MQHYKNNINNNSHSNIILTGGGDADSSAFIPQITDIDMGKDADIDISGAFDF